MILRRPLLAFFIILNDIIESLKMPISFSFIIKNGSAEIPRTIQIHKISDNTVSVTE